MKNPFVLYFSAVPIARLSPPEQPGGPVTGSIRDLYTLTWSNEAPVSPAQAAALAALTKMDAVAILSRLDQYQAALNTCTAGAGTASGASAR